MRKEIKKENKMLGRGSRLRILKTAGVNKGSGIKDQK